MQRTWEKINETAAKLKRQRRDERRVTFGKEALIQDKISRTSGAFSLGRDRFGAMHETKSIGSFPIVVDKWYVRMGFKQEDTEWLENREPKEVEAALKKGGIPRKMRRISLHIIPAVRLLAHISSGYAEEIAKA